MADVRTVWKERLPALEAIFGPADDDVATSPVPLRFGGGADVLTFRQHVSGVTYVTSGLTGGVDHVEQAAGGPAKDYELVISLPKDAAWAPNLTSMLAPYTFDVPLRVGETMDLPPDVAAESTELGALLFTELDLGGKSFTFGGASHGLLLCVGITKTELRAKKKRGGAWLARELAAAGVLPFTDLRRTTIRAAEEATRPFWRLWS